MGAKKGKHQRPSSVAGAPKATIDQGNYSNKSKQGKSYWPAIIIVALSFILYGSSVNFGYVLDDEMVITKNIYVQQGINGLAEIFKYDSFQGYFQNKENLYLLEGGRYRPLSIATFALEISLFGADRPDISHFTNILLYAMTGIILMRLLQKLYSENEELRPVALTFAIIASLIWIVHPIHSECVANIKGRDEILSLIGCLAALWAAMKYAESKEAKWLIASGAFLFTGLLAKESSLTFVAVIPLTLWFFYKSKPELLVKTTSPLIIAAVAFILIRYSALGYFLDHGKGVSKLMNDPFLEMSVSEKYATIVYTLGWYLKLLFAPYPLTHDYYPYHVPKMNWGQPEVILSLLVYVAMSGWAAYKLKSRNLYAFGIMFFLITLTIVSNLFVAIGTFMNERFLYAPSIGFAIMLGHLLTKAKSYADRNVGYKKVFAGIVALPLIGCIWITINRTADWKDPMTLEAAAIKVSQNSARANAFYAVSLYNNKYLQLQDVNEQLALLDTMDHYVDKSIEIYPEFESGWHMKAGLVTARYQVDKDEDKLFKGLKEVLEKGPENELTQSYVDKYVLYLFTVYPEKTNELCYEVGFNHYYRRKKDIKSARKFMQFCLDHNNNSREIVEAYAEICEAGGDKGKAAELRRLIATN